jgi:preprotein translocase subunit YajC
MNAFVLPLLMGAPDQAAGAGTTASLISTFVPFGLVILIFYFLIIRPQNKKQKETEKMLAALKKGDKIVTIGGIHGVIQSVKEGTVVVKVDDSTKIEFSRSAIASVVESAKAEKSATEAVTDETK